MSVPWTGAGLTVEERGWVLGFAFSGLDLQLWPAPFASNWPALRTIWPGVEMGARRSSSALLKGRPNLPPGSNSRIVFLDSENSLETQGAAVAAEP